ncbi:GNAT family N-acetyltransferase [Mucilaginibacter sp. 21P]|uniref:GNAT family N-acetyltransferase n=1 Tax=Mucilaginibacter sp. 21P TaxID=2778902 RepID=UPI001C58956C|nr:GNAT family N-acetyltransferase [Mucilaginibacter sp. 21P]QXV64819.1 GNAT family N-acetyltransferase [Mucilaginibacter sp. 21P]
MAHVLDNPIYNALTTGNKHLAVEAGGAFYFKDDVAPFAGLKNNSAADFEALLKNAPDDRVFVIFTPEQLHVPDYFKVLRDFKMFQMVYEADTPPTEMESSITSLEDEHVEEMLALTRLTNPGPFLQRTIDFSNYTGVFTDGNLIAMAGHRMQPLPYVEISAVCTHPEHTGKGHAAKLLLEQARRIIAAGKTPFLHVLQENTGAIKVYERIGFKTRVPILGYVLSK